MRRFEEELISIGVSVKVDVRGLDFDTDEYGAHGVETCALCAAYERGLGEGRRKRAREQADRFECVMNGLPDRLWQLCSWWPGVSRPLRSGLGWAEAPRRGPAHRPAASGDHHPRPARAAGAETAPAARPANLGPHVTDVSVFGLCRPTGVRPVSRALP